MSDTIEYVWYSRPDGMLIRVLRNGRTEGGLAVTCVGEAAKLDYAAFARHLRNIADEMDRRREQDEQHAEDEMEAIGRAMAGWD